MGEKKESTYKEHVSPVMTPEKKYIYQIFILLNTHKLCDNRKTFPIDYILSVEDKINVELKRKTLERRMKENQMTSADEILAFINEYASEVGVDAIDPSEEAASEEGMLEKEVTLEEEEQTLGANMSKEKLTLPKMKLPLETFVYMKDNPWQLGLAKQRESDVLKVRLAVKKNAEKKKELRQAIVQKLVVQKSSSDGCKVGMECNYVPEWQQYVRRRSNNLKTS